MEHKVKGCSDCNFNIRREEYIYSYCGHPAHPNNNGIPDDEDKLFEPITPDWCPLKKQPITISIK